MCGITGFWELKNRHTLGHEKKIVAEMATVLKSRGPDGEGVWVDEDQGIALGHRRLSIIDLSPTGHQPMVSHSGRFVLTYNGEVYNFKDIRSELEKKGSLFRGASDTEVILEALEQYGVAEAVQKFSGMFAFALWDRQEKNLYLVRDRLGVKPLYWGLHQGVLFFGSQLKSFRPHPAFNPSLNKEAVGAYFRYNYIPAPKSIFQDFFKLEPGHILKITLEGKITNTPYWELSKVIEQRQNSFASLDSLTESLEVLLKDSVKQRMIADVPLGCFLSGGIDSSLVAALMQSESSSPIKTFTIGFTEEEFNESLFAKQIAAHLGTDHHEMYMSPKECFEVIPHLSEWFDEPFADSSQIPTYLVSKMAREHVTVALSGDGGDELFAGYSRYKIANKRWNCNKKIPFFIRSKVGKVLENIHTKYSKEINNLPPNNLNDKIYSKSCSWQAPEEAELYMKLFVNHWAHPENLVLGLKDTSVEVLTKNFQNKGLSFIEKMQLCDMKVYLPNDILVKVDRTSMAVGLEAREPLLDHRLVEFAWQQIPLRYKIHQGHSKWILKKVLSKYIPRSYYERPKMGFGIPLERWLKNDLKEWAEDLLSPELLKQQRILNSNEVQECWKNHLKGHYNNQHKLWGILMFQSWLEKWKLG